MNYQHQSVPENVLMNDHAEQVILVDEADRAFSHGGKLQIHEEGLLHRAFSIFVFNDAGECLIQKRASGKYHSAGKWANSCCGHPRPGEPTAKAAGRRLTEETPAGEGSPTGSQALAPCRVLPPSRSSSWQSLPG